MESLDLTTFTALRDSKRKVHLILGFPREIDILEEGKKPEDFFIDEILHLPGGVTLYLVCTNYQTCSPYTVADRHFAISLVQFYRKWRIHLYDDSTPSPNQQLQRPRNPVGHIQRERD